jgi:hypothetical protein
MGPGNMSVSNRSLSHWFNTNAFTAPLRSATEPESETPLGTSRRARGSGTQTSPYRNRFLFRKHSTWNSVKNCSICSTTQTLPILAPTLQILLPSAWSRTRSTLRASLSLQPGCASNGKQWQAGCWKVPRLCPIGGMAAPSCDGCHHRHPNRQTSRWHRSGDHKCHSRCGWGHILSVGKSTSSVPPGAKVIDLSEYTVIPGLIDVHTRDVLLG